MTNDTDDNKQMSEENTLSAEVVKLNQLMAQVNAALVGQTDIVRQVLKHYWLGR